MKLGLKKALSYGCCSASPTLISFLILEEFLGAKHGKKVH
jgi:hypothetical protein